MRAFIFSLDAFVAFTLALIAIYSLIFFSSVPSSYYYLLTQGHYLSRDTLLALSTLPCQSIRDICGGSSEGTVLERIAFPPSGPGATSRNSQQAMIQRLIEPAIPSQFGFIVETKTDSGWRTIYDRKDHGTDDTVMARLRNRARRMSVSSQVLTFGYKDSKTKPTCSPFTYWTCGAGIENCDSASSVAGTPGSGRSNPGTSLTGDDLVLTCPTTLTVGSSSGDGGSGGSTSGSGGGSGSESGTGSVVSGTEARIVRLTVYI